MAEEDAEIALLHQLQAGQEATAWGVGGDGATEGELPSNTEDNNEHVKNDSVTDDPSLRALSHSDAAGVSENGVYAPVPVAPVPAVTMIAEQDQSRSSSQTSMRKPKTVGGFLADDSDEENDDSTSTAVAAASLQPPASDNAKPSISPSPLQSSISQQGLPLIRENQVDLKDNAPASTNVSVNTSNVGTPIEQAPVQVPASTTAAQNVSGPKARLPHDKTGILEDRIKEDPRGDMEAWLSLISEHRKRTKLDDARAVYERFLRVFPHAVSFS